MDDQTEIVETEQPPRPKKKQARVKSSRKIGKKKSKTTHADGATAKFPRHSVDKALRIPRAIIEQNAGKECSDRESAKFVGVGFNGPYSVELSSAIKYGFLERPRPAHIVVTDRARQAIRPQKSGDDIEALREAVLAAPEISTVYSHYRGENLPDGTFFDNALVDKFAVPASKVSEFKEIFLESLNAANLIEEKGDKFRVLDITAGPERVVGPDSLKKISQGVKIDATDTCFVVMPFSGMIGSYYQQIYEPAIRKAGSDQSVQMQIFLVPAKLLTKFGQVLTPLRSWWPN